MVDSNRFVEDFAGLWMHLSYLAEQCRDDLDTVFRNISPMIESPSFNCDNWFSVTVACDCPIITKMNPTARRLTEGQHMSVFYTTVFRSLEEIKANMNTSDMKNRVSSQFR